MGDPRNVLAAFEAEGRALLAVVDALSADDLARPTNCPPWDLTELVVHLAGSVRAGALPSASDGAAPRDPADYYRRPERDTVKYRDANVRRAQRYAAHLRHRTAPEDLSTALRETATRMRNDDLDRLVEIDRVGPMRLGDWLATRVVALAAHGLDIAITLETPPWTTPGALAVTRPILQSLAGGPWPNDLGWDDGQLLAAGTGREPLTDRDRAALGATADRFPLLS